MVSAAQYTSPSKSHTLSVKGKECYTRVYRAHAVQLDRTKMRENLTQRALTNLTIKLLD